VTPFDLRQLHSENEPTGGDYTTTTTTTTSSNDGGLRATIESTNKISNASTNSVAVAAAPVINKAATFDDPIAHHVLKLEPAEIRTFSMEFIDAGRISIEEFSKLVKGQSLSSILLMMEKLTREALVLTVRSLCLFTCI
jgi:hypothetical protein